MRARMSSLISEGLSVVAIALFLESHGNLIPHRFFKTG
jgi:hypothetical protein